MNKERTLINHCLMSSLDSVDHETAIKVASNIDTDPKEITDLLVANLFGHIVNKNTNEVDKLPNSILCRLMLTRMEQFTDTEIKNNIK